MLGVARHDGAYVAAPRDEMICHPSDVLTVYGREDEVRQLLTPGDGPPPLERDWANADATGLASGTPHTPIEKEVLT